MDSGALQHISLNTTILQSSYYVIILQVRKQVLRSLVCPNVEYFK